MDRIRGEGARKVGTELLGPDGFPIAKIPFTRLNNKNEANAKVKHTRWEMAEKPYADLEFQTTITSGEAHLLYDAAKRLGSGNYANLGVFTGKSVYCLAHGLKHNGHHGKIYAVDVFHRKEEKLQPEFIAEKIREVMPYVEWCKGYTHYWAFDLRAKRFRFVFIDAGHYYENVKLDWDLWSPLVEVGGEIALHDTHCSSVDRLVQEIDYSQWQLVDHIYTMKLFKRLPDETLYNYSDKCGSGLLVP